MGGDDAGSAPATPHSPVEQIASRRAELVSLLADLPETRLSKATPRQGWTLRHELSWLAASDEELLHRLNGQTVDDPGEAHWRRVRGEAMHTAQELRLGALREHLEASGASVHETLGAQTDRLEERAVRSAIALHLEHAAAALESLRAVLGR